MNIILIRHGETALNRTRVLQPADTPLSERGVTQANAMATRLVGQGIDAILSSDMPRAAQSAQALSDSLRLPITFTPLLHERNFGDLRGQKFSALGFDPMDTDYAPVNGESWPVFHQRVADGFDLILNEAARTTGVLAVVAHGLVIREMVKRHLSTDDRIPEHFENTSVTIFSKKTPHRVSLMGCANHLRDDPSDAQGGIA